MLSQCLLGSVFHMFIHYKYLSINKNENGLRQMSLKYASIHHITPIFLNVHRKHDPEPPWQASGASPGFFFIFGNLHVAKRDAAHGEAMRIARGVWGHAPPRNFF